MLTEKKNPQGIISKINLKANKSNVITAIQKLLQSQTVGTQEEIREALSKTGLVINQAKISRILHKLGAIKMIENQRTVYRLPGELISVTPNHSLKNLILAVTHNEALIIIQTTPGSAQLVARVLDQNKDVGILGTVAGDDTIFVAPKKVSQMKSILQKISVLLMG